MPRVVGDLGQAARLGGGATLKSAMDECVAGIFAHCREVVAASRALRAEAGARRVDSYVLHARYALAATAVARTHRRGRRPRRPLALGVQGGAGGLDGIRVALVTDDPDTRDLLMLLMKWYGAEFAVLTTGDVAGGVAWFRPELLLIAVPFEPDGAFALVARLR